MEDCLELELLMMRYQDLHEKLTKVGVLTNSMLKELEKIRNDQLRLEEEMKKKNREG